MGFHRGPKIVTDGLVLYVDAANPKSYSGTGTTWYDLSGNNNHGELINGPVFIQDSGASSISFDGVNDYVSIPELNLENEWTVNLLVNEQSTGIPLPILRGNITNNTTLSSGRLQLSTGVFNGINGITLDTDGNFYVGTFGMGEFEGVFRFELLKFDSKGNLIEEFELKTPSGSIWPAGAAVNIGIAMTTDNRLFGGGTNIPQFSEINNKTGQITYLETKFNGNYDQTYVIDETTRSIYRCSTNTTTYSGNPWKYISKLDLDTFELDTNFNPLGSFNVSTGLRVVGFNPDGHVFYSGEFTSYQGVAAKHIILLDKNTAEIVTSFNTGTGFNDARYIQVHCDSLGRVYVLGRYITSYNGVSTPRKIVRLKPDGSLDTTYTTNMNRGTDFLYLGSALQPDNKLVVHSYSGLFRVNEDGTIDSTFDGSGYGGFMGYFMGPPLIQPDGKIILSNSDPFQSYSYKGVPYKTFIRLNSDGSIDESFNTNVGFTNSTTRYQFNYTYETTPSVIGNFTDFGVTGRNSPPYWRNFLSLPRIYSFVKSSDGTLRLYLNGALNKTYNVSSYNNMNLKINKILEVNRKVNSIRIYNKALSVTEINLDMLTLIKRYGYDGINDPIKSILG